jgi:RNA polymerase sigma-70 factor, ECF subfamily
MIDWNTVVRENSAMIFGVAWRMLGHASDAEDVVQEVFAEAYRTSKGKKIVCWTAFLRKIAACRALDALRQRKRFEPLPSEGISSMVAEPAMVAVSRELEARLQNALRELPGREAEVFCLRYFEDLPYREIADALEISPTAVSTALNQARSRLETLLDQKN